MKKRFKKRFALMLCVAMALLLLPMISLPDVASAAPDTAASTITIGVDTVTASNPTGTDGSGGEYSFTDGTLTLDGYKAEDKAIKWNDGFLNIVVNGDCAVQNISNSDMAGTLTISGRGTLKLSADGDAINLQKGLRVDEATVHATNTKTGEYNNAVAVETGDVTVTNKGKLIAATLGTGDASGLRINNGNLTVEEGGFVQVESAGQYGIRLDRGNLTIQSGGSVEGNAPVGFGVVIKGNITVDDGTLSGNGYSNGINVNGGDITLESGAITGTTSGDLAAIYVGRSGAAGGRIMVNGGTLTGENTSTTSSEYANSIRAEYGMEITDGKVIGKTSNPGAAAVWVQGDMLDMSGGELEGTNSATTGNANGVLAEGGITMKGNSKMTGTNQSTEGGIGIRSYADITLMGSSAGKPSMTGIGASGIVATDIQSESATIKAVGSNGAGIGCNTLDVANSVVDAQSKNAYADPFAINSLVMNLSGENTIHATGAGAGIHVSDSLKAVGNQYVHATATGWDGLTAVEPFGYGIIAGNYNILDVNLTKGYIQATGVKGKIKDQSNEYNTGGGIGFFNNNANVTLGANTKVEGGQVLIDGNPVKDWFKHAYGTDGVVEEQTVIYADVDYSIAVKITGKGTVTPASVKLRALLNQEFTFTPDAGYRVKSVKVNGVEQSNLSSYTIERIVRDYTIEVAFEKGGPMNPQTGDDANTSLWLWLMLGAVAILGMVARRRLHA
ncbi:carbohydrate-binding domain-containing protein [Eubacteriales bacterium OttesenSCG-928-M02]|nr:carbohydrate-binding domain-containing protein [Eubacteriales bacterium OttesenSCG-928-M02]